MRERRKKGETLTLTDKRRVPDSPECDQQFLVVFIKCGGSEIKKGINFQTDKQTGCAS